MILDSSAIIALSHLKLLDKVVEFFEIIIPESVYKEVAEKGYCLIGSHELLRVKEKIKIARAKERLIMKILSNKLGKGEAETIALGLELNDTIIIDDKDARKIAKDLNLKFKGTLGLLIKLVRKDIIKKDDFKTLMKRLEDVGFRISDKVIQRVIEML